MTLDGAPLNGHKLRVLPSMREQEGRLPSGLSCEPEEPVAEAEAEAEEARQGASSRANEGEGWKNSRTAYVGNLHGMCCTKVG